MNRRELLKLSAAVGITAATAGCNINGGYDDQSGSSGNEEEQWADEHFYMTEGDYE